MFRRKLNPSILIVTVSSDTTSFIRTYNHKIKRKFFCFGIKSTLCEALKVAKGSYYNHILRNKNGNTKAANRRSEMFPVIEQIFHDYNEI